MGKPLVLTLLAAACVLTASCRHHSDVKEDFVTAINAQRGREYPKVNSEGRVRVCIYAPYALSVKIDITGIKFPLRRVDQGLWIGETEPLDEGFHYYQIQIDGASVPDPSSEYYYGAGRWGSGVDIPPADHDFYESHDVPQGQTREIWYRSALREETRRLFVYTPPCYDSDQSLRLPVLYLLPGGAESECSWIQQGHLAQILDNLLSEGKAEPFIAVSDHCMLENPYDWEETYYQRLTGEVMPLVDSLFRTIPDKDHRAMAGLSYGGLYSKLLSLEHPDLFSYTGIFSGGTITVDEAKEHPGFAEGIKLLFISYGSFEIDRPIFGIEEGTDPRQETQDLKDWGVNAYYYISPGTHHEWLSWRRSLYQFAQLIFRQSEDIKQ